jgi:hypothetical protein
VNGTPARKVWIALLASALIVGVAVLIGRALRPSPESGRSAGTVTSAAMTMSGGTMTGGGTIPFTGLTGERSVTLQEPPALAAAVPGEKPIERWRRTKANWEAMEKWQEDADAQIGDLTLPSFEEYQVAEQALATVPCDKLCTPAGAKP